jgi:hypothetical protein
MIASSWLKSLHRRQGLNHQGHEGTPGKSTDPEWFRGFEGISLVILRAFGGYCFPSLLRARLAA